MPVTDSPVFHAAVVCTAAALWYLTYLTRVSRRPSFIDRSTDSQQQTKTADTFIVCQLSVPREAVGAVIGKDGETVRRLQQATRTRIRFADRQEDSPDSPANACEQLVVRGNAADVRAAEAELKRIVDSVPLKESDELLLASRFVGPLIGRGGAGIRGLMAQSGCRIDVERRADGAEADRLVQLRGTRQQIEMAKGLIDEVKARVQQSKREQRHGRGDQYSGRGDQYSGRGDQYSGRGNYSNSGSSGTAGHSNNTTGHSNHTTVHNNDATGHSNHATDHSNYATAHSNDATIHSNDATVHSNDATVHSNHATDHSNDTTDHSNHATDHSNYATVHSNHATVHSNDATDHSNSAPSTESWNSLTDISNVALDATAAAPPPTFAAFPDSDADVEVCVTAVGDDPLQFNLLTVSSHSLALESLVRALTRCYSTLPPRHPLGEGVDVGDFVAAPYEWEETWQRARVQQVLRDGETDIYDVDFLDYGDCARVEKAFRLLPEFYLQLPFQAISCTLDVSSLTESGSSEECVEAFQQLTHCSKFQPIRARRVGTQEQTGLPVLRLTASHACGEVDVISELRRLGYCM